MATASFTKQMNFNKKESKELFVFLESENKSNHKVKTPTAKKASRRMPKRIFAEKRNNDFSQILLPLLTLYL